MALAGGLMMTIQIVLVIVPVNDILSIDKSILRLAKALRKRLKN
jgi:hypothetical protein